MPIKMKTIRLAFIMAGRSIGRRKFRSALTILSIAIGISTMVALMTIGEGMHSQVQRTLNEILGAGVVMRSGDMGASIPEYLGDYISQVPGVNNSVPVVMTTMDIGGRQIMVVGIDPDQAASLYKIVLSEGRALEVGEDYSAVIGSTTADLLGLSVNDTITLSSRAGGVGERFKVVGILRSIGKGELSVGCFISLEASQRLLGREGYVSAFLITLDDPSQAEYVEHVLKDMFPAASILSEETLLGQINQIMGIINGVLLALGSVSLLVGAIGVVNTITMSVHERTREIGMMKAVGGERWHVLLIFLSEAAIIGLIGGPLGCILGLSMLYVLQCVVSMIGMKVTIPLIISPQIMSTALVIGLAVSTTAGFYPSWKAANIRPVEALRYE